MTKRAIKIARYPSEEIIELDNQLQLEIASEWTSEEWFWRESLVEVGAPVECASYPIAIDAVQEQLTLAKSKGASHISIAYSDDVTGYNFQASLIQEATQNDLDARQRANQIGERKRKERAIERMRAEADELEQSLTQSK